MAAIRLGARGPAGLRGGIPPPPRRDLARDGGRAEKAGIRNYSIFRHGLTLFGYFETDDLDATIAALKDDPVNARWSEWMAPIMRIEIDSQRGFPFLLPLQWHMD